MTSAMEGFQPLCDVLADASSPLGPAELHGGLCGLMCAGGIDVAHAWLEERLQECSADAADPAWLAEALQTMESETWRTLAGNEMTFAPLLPDEDEPLEHRVESLAAWCQGFVSGLGLGGFQLDGDLLESPDELAEILVDFVEIGKATYDATDREREDQADFSFAEVVEYVRVSVQIVYEELSERQAGGAGERIH